MTSAVVQGVPLGTVDIDIWVDLPVRQYVRVLAIGRRLGARILSGSVLGLRNDARMDFIYRMDGVASFNTEWRRAVPMEFAGQRIKVLALESLIRSKEASGRPKDLAQLQVLRVFLASRRIKRR